MAVAAGSICDRTVGGRGEVVSSEEENGLEISSRARSVTHLAVPPTSRVPPSYVAPRERPAHITQKRGGAHSCGSTWKRERRGRRWWWWWETRGRETRSSVTLCGT